MRSDALAGGGDIHCPDCVGALYTHPVLNRYGFRSVPPIHIIVKNGEIRLEGVVNRESEKNVAGILANGVSGAFAVTNNLRVEKI